MLGHPRSTREAQPSAASPLKPPGELGSRSTNENENNQFVGCFFSFLFDCDEHTRPSGFIYKLVLVFILAELPIFSLVFLVLSGGLTKGLSEVG